MFSLQWIEEAIYFFQNNYSFSIKIKKKEQMIQTTLKNAAADTEETIGELFDFVCFQCHYIEFVDTIHSFFSFFIVTSFVFLLDWTFF